VPPDKNIQDTGIGVRKRVIKLFKSVYQVEHAQGRRVDICHKLVLRMLDEDETVKVCLNVKYSGSFPDEKSPHPSRNYL
jgi:hypothetical protein